MKTNSSADLIAWLEDWYRSQCDGDWEHAKGVEIASLDNPGWSVTVNLTKLPARGGPDRTLSVFGEPPSARNGNVGGPVWMECKVTNGQFVGAGDPGKLRAILEQLRTLVAGA